MSFSFFACFPPTIPSVVIYKSTLLLLSYFLSLTLRGVKYRGFGLNIETALGFELIMPQRRGRKSKQEYRTFPSQRSQKRKYLFETYGQGQEEDVREMLKRRSGQEWSENKGIVCRLPPSYKPVFVLFLSGSFPEKFYRTQSFYTDSNGQMVNGDITPSLIWSMIRLYLHL